MADRYEFRFVVAGTTLSKAHQEKLAGAVAEAGTKALAEIEFKEPRSVANFIPRDWLGRWLHVLEPRVAERVGKELGVEGRLVAPSR